MNQSISKLNNKIINCKSCPRLIKFRDKIIKNKRKQFINETYWGKPITGFGDINARILFVGLAPAAHGGTRTGRVFTGDKSSDFLYKCLFKTKISNQSNSDHVEDGLKLKNAYITTALKCVPPEDKPLNIELDNCSKYFNSELEMLKKLKVVVALGKIAFDACKYFYQKRINLDKNIKFGHGNIFKLENGISLVACYHPSPRNVNTGRINESKMVYLFNKIKTLN
tara:strand:+ start:1911 stop:2585 length:675 start_codon:yes stop_codon:yes gene_type:complete